MKLKPHELTCHKPCKPDPCKLKVDAIDIFDAVVRGAETKVLCKPYLAKVEEVAPVEQLAKD